MNKQAVRDVPDGVATAVSNVRVRFLAKLEERADDLFDDLEALSDAQGDGAIEEAFTTLSAKVHKLHGLAGAIGFPRVGALAVKIENHIDLLLNGTRPLETSFVQDLLNELLDEIERVQDEE